MLEKACLRFFQCDEALEREIRGSLDAAGLLTYSEFAGRYGIVCFGSVDEELVAGLHDVRRDERRRVIAVAASAEAASPATAWRLLHAGASDVLTWSHDCADQLAAKIRRWSEVDELAAQATAEESLIGDSPAWNAIVHKIVEAARFSPIPILLIGESGTGKELLARLISNVSAGMSGKYRKELITVDCGSLAPELSGSELFGHERGAFTGAHSQREGAFALADGATLLLDEIGEVPLGLQVQLLRAIQEKSYKRVGGNVWQKTNFRLVCATNRDLEELVRRGQFRLDLYHRIAGCVFRTPTLAERKADILPLAKFFLTDCVSPGVTEFNDAVADYLLNREYPGNIRELRQLVSRMALRHAGPGPITAGDIPEDDRPASGEIGRAWPDEELERSISNALATGASLKEITQATAETAIRIAVQSEGSNLQRAASRLGITDRALQMRRANGRLEAKA